MKKITKENIKYYIQLTSKKLRTEWTSDFVPTYYYDYKIKFYESNKKHRFSIEVGDLEKDFKDVDYSLILHYVSKLK
tara:strand:- start:295 stop:525 length:231 start_codon:yes stop_codon:yes gene_type:complete